jgi:hypothetical protein
MKKVIMMKQRSLPVLFLAMLLRPFLVVPTGAATPVPTEMNMNTEMAAMSPGNQANSVLSRAATLFLKNLGGQKVGVNTMAVQEILRIPS